MSLVLGHIAYLNCVPFFHHLRESGFDGAIVPGVPSALNAMLQRGALDVCPSSSFEYGQHCSLYRLLPGLSISSRGPVQSVLLFSPVPPEQLGGVPIALTGESATSVNLMRVLLREYCGVPQEMDYVPDAPVERLIGQGIPGLLIGDRAMRMAQLVDPSLIYDLGELWFRFTGLPFVFALWMVRRQVAEERSGEVRQLLHQLRRSLAQAQGHLEELARGCAAESGLSAASIANYWQTMSYGLDDEHLQGLKHYFALCHRHGLLEHEPEVQFVAE